jgi:hypothetical protein
MYGVELLGLGEMWKETDKLHSQFCKKLLGLPACTANCKTEMELEKVSRKGKVMWLTAKYWQQIMHMDTAEPVGQCYK